jgi:hypothetical protein
VIFIPEGRLVESVFVASERKKKFEETKKAFDGRVKEYLKRN